MENNFLKVHGYDETPQEYAGEGTLYYHVHLDGRFIVSAYQISAKDAYALNITDYFTARMLWDGYQPFAVGYRRRLLAACLNVECRTFPTLEA